MAASDRGVEGESVARVEDEAVIERMLADWRSRLRATVDAQPRAGDRGVRERALVRALLAYASLPGGDSHGARTPEADARLEALALAAALYGANLPRERLDPQTLCSDLSELRDVVWRQLRELELSAEAQTARILRFDQALSIALRAALTGGYRLAPPDGRAFAETLDEVIADCSSVRSKRR